MSTFLWSFVQVFVLGVESRRWLSSKQEALPCERGFTQTEHIIRARQELAKGQAVFNGKHTHTHTPHRDSSSSNALLLVGAVWFLLIFDAEQHVFRLLTALVAPPGRWSCWKLVPLAEKLLFSLSLSIFGVLVGLPGFSQTGRTGLVTEALLSFSSA